MRLPILITALVVVAAAPAQAEYNAGHETTSAGAITATLSWEAGEIGPAGARLQITRAGAVAFDEPIPRPCGVECQRDGHERDDFQIVDLDADNEPEVFLKAYNADREIDSLAFYHYDAAAGTYREYVKDWFSFAQLYDYDEDGRLEVVTHDGRWKDEFEGPAQPLHVMRYQDGALHDVTRQFGAQVRADALNQRGMLNDLKPRDPVADGLLAAYVADLYLLGRRATAIKELDRYLAKGLLGGPRTTAAYRDKLLKLLRRYGYR